MNIQQVFKPKAKTHCKRCRDISHHYTDSGCHAHTPLDLQGTAEAFYGGKFPLFNLHKCPHGCVLKEGEPGWEKIFHTSEHRYQFYNLKEHDKVEEAFDLLEEENSFKVMQKAKAVLPESELNEEWKNKHIDTMSTSCAMKFCSCPHAMQALLDSRVTIAEATGDLYWGMGLNVPQTEACLQEFWPGKNIMGSILMDLCSMFQEENRVKHRAESPLSGISKRTDYGSSVGVSASDGDLGIN